MIDSGRHCSPYPRAEQAKRLLWAAVQSGLFYYSPRPLWKFRVWLLRLFGAKIGRQVYVYNTAKIFCPWLLTVADHSAIGDGAVLYNLGPMMIGSYVTISQRAYLCGGTHNYLSREMKLLRAPITIEDDAWICAEAFIGPNVTVGKGAIVGARGVVCRNIEHWTIVCGNPAKFIKNRNHLVDSLPRSTIENVK